MDVFLWRAGTFCLELLNSLAHMFGVNGLKPVLLAHLCSTYCYVFFLRSSAPCWETNNGDVSNDDLHTRLSFRLNAVFSSVSLFTSMLFEFPICAMRAACPAAVILISILLGEQYQLWIPSLRISSVSFYFRLLSSLSQSMSFLQCGGQTFALVYRNK
jgi:hypothetical protein